MVLLQLGTGVVREALLSPHLPNEEHLFLPTLSSNAAFHSQSLIVGSG